MKAEPWRTIGLALAAFLFFPGCLPAAEPPPLPLPQPRQDGGMPLLRALKERKSLRQFSTQPVPPRLLSDLLWAGFGINRPENAHRTAPSTMNSQEIDIYLATRDGLYLYDAVRHQLTSALGDDIRALTGGQDYVTQAPLALVFVADLARLSRAKPEQREHYAAVDTGFISQNIYLYCASEGLATVVHEVSNPAKLAEAMRLRPDQKVILAQSVGYPKSL